MDGISATSSSTLATAASGTSEIAAAVLTGTEQLVANEVQTLFASLGLGTAISALA
ncbi:MAG TPA: hypothetical protein VGN14_09045 [Candidatus Elarobacter sp.]|jgi:hypothetical protein